MPTSDTDSLLLELEGDFDKGQDNETPNELTKDSSEETPVTSLIPIKKSDISDLTQTDVTVVPLTDTEYLVLAEFAEATPKEVLATKYELSVREINKIIRKPNAVTFLSKIRENKEEETLNRLSGLTNKAIEQKTKAIHNLFENGQEALAFGEMFGKLSMVEVMEKLNKMQPDDEKEDDKGINVFFNNLTSRN